MKDDSEDLLTFGFQHDYQSIIKVVGVGGGGGNAVNHMFLKGIAGVDFLVCNTDAQALVNSPVPVKVQLGVSLTEGRGAGNKPKRGEQAAIENLAEIRAVLETGTKMVFITAGMGGGTGTGAAPVIAQLAREMDILTIAVVTLPSIKEGRLRYEQAVEGIKRLQRYVDSLLVISNENLHKVYGDLPAREAFAQADNIVAAAVKGCAEIITLHGNINIDFADVNTVLRDSGVFIMGTGFAEGENRATRAAEEALRSPLLDSNDIFGTENILLNITSGEEEVRMGEIGDIIDYLQNAAGDNANIIWGNGYDAKLGNKISVTVIATGFEINPNRILSPEPVRENVVVPVYDRIEESESMIVDREDPPQIVPEYRPTPPVSQPISQPIPEPVPVSAPAPVEATAPTYTPEPERSILEFDAEPFTVRKDEKEVETARQERNTKKTPIPKIKDGNEPIGSWFNRQFGALFNEDEDDVEIKR